MDLSATFKQIQKASASLVKLSDATINRILVDTADAALTNILMLLQANARDLA